MTKNKQMNQRKLSKFLSLILRHKPETINIQLDKNGWANLDELITGLRTKGMIVKLRDIEEVVAENDKQRFKLDLENNRIRANQGHSIKVDVELQETEPPAVLFHGTAKRYLDNILAKGLKKMSRQHVHLSQDKLTATKVGQRHGKPVILRIDAQALRNTGQKFYLSENGVWLSDDITSEYITLDA